MQKEAQRVSWSSECHINIPGVPLEPVALVVENVNFRQKPWVLRFFRNDAQRSRPPEERSGQ